MDYLQDNIDNILVKGIGNVTRDSVHLLRELITNTDLKYELEDISLAMNLLHERNKSTLSDDKAISLINKSIDRLVNMGIDITESTYYDFIDSTDLAILQLCEIELSSSFRGIVKQIKKEG